MLGNAGLTERSAARYLPYIGHERPDVVLLEDGSRLAMGRVFGLAHELSAVGERNAAARVRNSLWRAVADEAVTVGVFFVRHPDFTALPLSQFGNAFTAALDRVYRERVLDGQLFRNDWFLSLILAPRVPGGGTAGVRQLNRRLARLRKRELAPDPERLDELDYLRGHVARSLEGYRVERLGLRPKMGSGSARSRKLCD